MFALFEIELGLGIIAMLCGNVLGVVLLALGMYGYMPRWLRGGWLILAWLLVVLPPAARVAQNGWRSVAFLLTPTAGMIIATWAAWSRREHA